MAENIKLTPISQEMRKSYLDYAMSVIVARALPDIRDGLKPVQRRIIYAMYKQGLRSSGGFAKCAAVVGETMKNYHPHGDVAIYDTLVRMAQEFSLRYPLVEGQGNFGSVDGDPPAAMRYTECRMKKIADELLKDLEKETVGFADNYAATTQEPILLPATIPNLLANGATGIAVGMATNIPPHNLTEIIDAVIFAIDNPEEGWSGNTEIDPEQNGLVEKFPVFESAATVDDLLQFIKGPDFPTGATAYDQREIKSLYETGRAHIPVRAKTEIEEMKGGKFRILVSELPYQVNKATLVAKIADLARSGKIKEISDLRDESNRDGMRVVIELKRDSSPKRVLNRLFKHTQLQDTFHANLVCLIDGQPRTVNLKIIIEEFIRHRTEVIVRRTQFDLARAREREHILQGLKIALDHLDEVIETIKKSKDTESARTALVKKFKLTEIQAQAILDLQLKRLAQLERKKIEDELKEIIELIDQLIAILRNPKKVIEITKKELEEVKENYGDGRRTKIVKSGVGEFSEEELIPNEEVIVAVTRSGYIKRMSAGTFKQQGRGGKGVRGMETKEDDTVSELFIASTHDRVLFFTNKGRVFDLRVWDIPEAGRTAKGQAMVNLLELRAGEKVTACLRVENGKN